MKLELQQGKILVLLLSCDPWVNAKYKNLISQNIKTQKMKKTTKTNTVQNMPRVDHPRKLRLI